MEKQSNIILSIAMLVSNRIDTIKKCMEGLRPLLEAIPSELIIVDTVGEENSDGSLAVAKEYADKVVHFDWCNDFSAARNAGLFQAQGEWFLYQDDDEWFGDVTEIIEFFRSGEYKKYNCATYRTRDYYNLQGGYSMGLASRMIKLEKDTKFVQPIHEYLSPMKRPCKALSSFTHHYGYVFSTPEKKKAHSQRNVSLLEPEFEKNPWDMHVRMQLIQEYVFLDELKEKARILCEETLEQADAKLYKTNEFQWILVSYVRLASSKNDYETILERSKMVRKKFPVAVLTDLAISTMEAKAFCNKKLYEKGLVSAEHALEMRKYLLDNPDVFDYLRVLDLETFLEDSMYGEILKICIQCHYNLGNFKKAEKLSKERFLYMTIPVLTISVLVSNRKETVKKCLESVKPLLDAVPCEIIIVDTVGEANSDGSLAIAKEYTDHIVTFSWCDDFAAARNAGLKEARGEWFLYLDDDEWFENVDEIISFFSSGEYLEFNSATYVARNYKNGQEIVYTDMAVARMVHRSNNTEFVGCINETFSNIYEPHKTLTSYVHHYGFAYATSEAKQARMQYTLRLLQKDLEKYPNNLRNRAQLAAVLSVKAPMEAVKVCEGTLELCKEKKETAQYQWQVVVLFGLYENLKLIEAAEAVYQKLIAEDLLLSVAEQVVCYRMARMQVSCHAYAKALAYVKRYDILAEAVSRAEIPKEFEKYQGGSCTEEMQNIRKFCEQQNLPKEEDLEEEILLSVSMLVSNRIDTVRKSMEALRPILEAVPSELIVVDTVGEENSDGSLTVAKEYATKVVHFDWCNDFSAARNAGLSIARGKWFLYQDDDEWFDDVTEIIDFFKLGEYKKYNCATYRTKDYFNREGGYSMGTASRMVKLEKNTQFVGTVHEYLHPMETPCKALSSFTHHYGYVFDTIEEHREHSRRNLSLLRPEFEKNSEDIRLRAQMVQECMFLEELEPEALVLCENVLEQRKENANYPMFQWILSAYVKLAVRHNNWAETVKRAMRVREKFSLSAFCDLAVSVMELQARGKLEQYEEAEKLLVELKKSREFLLSHPEQRAMQGCLDFEVYLENTILADAMACGIKCLYKAGKKKEAAFWVKERSKVLNAPMLSLSLLVSNNIITIEKCMESLRPLLEQIPSELIVVDTVGEENSDGSLAIAKQYTDKIVRFKWCNDFAAARNAGLEQAKGEWFLYLDDDEWFEDVSEMIEFFRSGEYLLYASGTYERRDYTNKEGTEYSTTVLGRMTRRGKNTKFVSPIHETFSELFLPCKTFSTYAHHYGYAYANEQEKQAHSERNMSILRDVLEKNPLDLRLRTQMALELANFDNQRALEFCEETFHLCAEQKTANYFQWQLSLVFRLYEALGTEADEAEKSYQNLKQQFAFNETAENAICYLMTRIFIIKNVPERAYPYAKKYFETRKNLLENKALQQLQMTADFARYQTENTYLEMLHFGAYCAFKAKAYADAWKWYEEMPWEKDGYSNWEALNFAAQLYTETSNKEALVKIVDRVKQNLKEAENAETKQLISKIISMLKGATDTTTGGPIWIKSNIKLTIGILVSNNIKTIRNCMESLKPILDAVSSELIVVDTVGEDNSDGSLAIAKEYATKVIHFDWCNDFSAARNVCIDNAKGEWFLYVDDDEWFDDVTEFIEFFNSGECEQYGQGAYYIQNYTVEGTTSRAMVGRFVRRTMQTRFVGKVHEFLWPVYPSCKLFSSFAYHSGYCYENEEEKKKHQMRNLALLRDEIEEEGYTPHLCAQMVQELLHVKETWDEGYDFCMKCIPVLVDEQKELANSCTQWVLVASVRYFSAKEDYEGMLRQAAYIKENYTLSELATLFMSAMVAGGAWSRQDYVTAGSYVKEYVEAKHWLDTHPEQAMEQNRLDFSDLYTEEIYIKLLYIGAMCANELGEYELASKYWKIFPWQKVGNDKVECWKAMNRTMEGLKALQEKQKRQERIKELLPLLNTLEEAAECAKIFATSDDEKGLNELLSGMQEVAITLGTSLDQLIGEGSEEVSLLEEYCELVWQCVNGESREVKTENLRKLQQIKGKVAEKIMARL